MSKKEAQPALVEVRMWQPRCRRHASLDRWLCVPVFRRVCLYHYDQSLAYWPAFASKKLLPVKPQVSHLVLVTI
jgi:hypothetical protein